MKPTDFLLIIKNTGEAIT